MNLNKISTKKLVGINLFLFVSSDVIVLVNIIINAIVMEEMLSPNNIASIGVGAFFRLCIVLGLAIEAYKGKNWARWGVVILSMSISKKIFTDSIVMLRVLVIRNYKSDFEEFGEIRFMDLKSKNPLGDRPIKIYQLNEQQATLLVTYLDNTSVVRV